MGENRRRPPRTEEQGFWSQKCVFVAQQVFFFEKKDRRRPPRAEEQGLFVIRVCVSVQNMCFFWWGNAGGRRAQKNIAFVTKHDFLFLFVVQPVFFFGETKPPEAAAHRRTGL